MNRLEVDESILTGEAVPVVKTLEALIAPKGEDGKTVDLAVGDRSNMAFRGTNVSSGGGRGVVCFVGPATQIGEISERLTDRSTNKKTALTLTMEHLMYMLFACGIVFGTSKQDVCRGDA